jgi:rhodanese-related sulfurtransferase
MKKLFLVLGLAISLFASSDLVIIKKDEAKKLYDESKALFIDARGNKLYQKGTIMGSLNLPVAKFKAQKGYLPTDKSAKIVTFCNGFKCEKSDELAVLLQQNGFTNVVVYKGGYPEWKESKYPLMGLVKECDQTAKAGDYKPKTPLTKIKGAEVYLLEDEDTMIDQFWFATVVLDKLPANIQLVDVRKPEQFKDGHIKGAINVPFKDEKIDTSKFPKDKLVVFYCNTGMMSTDAITSIEDTDGILMFDANVNCEGEKCTVEPNEVL